MPDNVIVVGELLQEHYLPEGPLRAVHTGRSAPAHVVAAELSACSVHCNSCGLARPDCCDRSTQASRHAPARRWSSETRRRFSSARSHPSSSCPLPSTRCRTPAAMCVSARGANERRSAGPRPGAAHPLAQLRLYLILLEHGLVHLLAHRQRLPPRARSGPAPGAPLLPYAPSPCAALSPAARLTLTSVLCLAVRVPGRLRTQQSSLELPVQLLKPLAKNLLNLRICRSLEVE